MKTPEKILISTLLVVFIFSVFASTLNAQEKSDKEKRWEAAQLFNQKYGNKWYIRWNYVTGTPSIMMGDKITKYSGTPEQIAKAFLTEEKKMFGIENVETDVYITKTNYSSIGGTRFQYTQKYKGIPILYSGYLVAVDNNGAIYYVSGDYFPDVSVITIPAVSYNRAVNIIRNDLTGMQINIFNKPVLSIFVFDRDKETISYRLVYQASTEINENMMVGAWQYIIDAITGEILFKNSLISDPPPNPLNSIGPALFPKDCVLEQNYPNPFNLATSINFELPKDSYVRLVVYDITGREVARLVDGTVEAGYHSVLWDASSAASGMYIYRITAGSLTQAKRMTVIK